MRSVFKPRLATACANEIAIVVRPVPPDLLQTDIDAGLAMIPDGRYDYAILSETLQEVRKPLVVLREMLRVARRGRVGGIWFGRRGVDGVLFPLLSLGLALVARLLLQGQLQIAVFRIAIPILASLAIIRTAARVLHVAFPQAPLARVVTASAPSSRSTPSRLAV